MPFQRLSSSIDMAGMAHVKPWIVLSCSLIGFQGKTKGDNFLIQLVLHWATREQEGCVAGGRWLQARCIGSASHCPTEEHMGSSWPWPLCLPVWGASNWLWKRHHWGKTLFLFLLHSDWLVSSLAYWIFNKSHLSKPIYEMTDMDASIF